ncbi:S9 family peptidase [Propionibacteriaceae bacterium Y1700]|uniref:S9 family peptidase n=1 Tax=Microlunatus sp. Y1700 TaxID=3418487 RepID=UPI003DA74745
MTSTPGPHAAESLTPPVADRRPIERTHHGDTVIDEYEWLRDKSDPDVIAHLEAENAFTEQQTAHLADLREDLYQSIAARTRQTDLSVPTYLSHGDPADGGVAYWYYSRTVEGQEYAIHCRVPATDPTTPPDPEGGLPGEQVLLDGNVEAEGHEFFSIGAFAVSPDGTRLAFSTDTDGGERYTLMIKDLTTGERLPDTIADTSYGVVWAGNDHLFFTRNDEAWRPYEVLRHRIGTEADNDERVLHEPDERFWVHLTDSRDERWILIATGSKTSAEWHILPTADPYATPRVIAPRRDDVDYNVEVAGDRLLILHNHDAVDFELAEAPLDATSPDQWRTVLPHRPGIRLIDVDAYAGHVVVSLRRDGLTAVHVIDRSGDGSLGEGRDVDFDEPLYTVSSGGNPEWEARTVRLSFSSLVTPDSVYDLDLDTGGLTLLKRTPVLDHPTHGAYDPTQLVQVREWVTAADGTQVPVSIVHRAGLQLDGSAPAVLYGYGSYELPTDPRFSISRLSYLDRGFVFAIAHVRGGGELGRTWYDDGKMLAKKNTFTDFVAVAEHLVERGWTSADRLGAMGGSAGGLLMGAVANLAPDRFAAIHAAVPFVDALTTILDPELPLTVTEWEEWGNPLEDPEVYAYMKSYTPYENVAEVAYPAILATTSLNDTRVFFTEPAKWVARLRATAQQPADRPILLKTEMVAGHGGVSGRYQGWREVAFEQAWLIDQLSAD